MQSARETVGRTAVVLVELAAGVELGKNDFNRRHPFDRVNLDRDAAPVILHGHRAVGVENHGDAFAEAAQRLVSRVIDGFLNDVQRMVGPGVHAGPVANGFQPFEDGNGIGGVAHAVCFSSGCHPRATASEPPAGLLPIVTIWQGAESDRLHGTWE